LFELVKRGAVLGHRICGEYLKNLAKLIILLISSYHRKYSSVGNGQISNKDDIGLVELRFAEQAASH